MKKMISLFLAVSMLFSLAACGAKAEETPVKKWSREGYYSDENDNFLSVTWMEDIDEPGWYVGVMIGEDFVEDSYGGTLPQEGNTLHGALPSGGSKADITVTVSEEGEDGLQLVIDSGETYHFQKYEMPEAAITVNINTDGVGNIAYAEGEDAPEIDPEYPFQSAYIGLAEPAVYTFVAWPHAGYVFIKWTKNGEDLSTESQITLLLDESADYIAVFEEDPGWQNPVMNFVGEYQCDRAHALVECLGNDEAWITIEWGSSAWEFARWIIFGRLDTDTLTISYSGSSKSIVTVDDGGEERSEDEYVDGTGTITFHADGTFIWHEDQSDRGTDMVFEWIPVSSAAVPEATRQDGERFETVIFLEGLAETVHYEHIRNDTLGFEMDYDYELFERHSEADRERFVSVYDAPENPENYLEVKYRAETADTVAADVRNALSQEYELLESTRELDRIGSCIRIEASELKGTGRMSDHLQVVYIIPASDGCFVATESLGIVESEGFGHRFDDMLNTLSVTN